MMPMTLSKSALIVLLGLGVALATGMSPAQAEEKVPRILNDQLPVAGTCAPIRTTGVTHVMVGKADEAKWFRVAGVKDVLDLQGLVALLKQRAGANGSEHAVWITASAEHAWVHAVLVRNAAQAAGIYRVGIRVRSDKTGQVLGFPIFLPPKATGRPTGKAGLLAVRINTLSEKKGRAASDTGHVFAAVRAAQGVRQKFGVDQVVGSMWIATNAPLQYAISCIDLLYRGGCAGVKLRNGARVPPLKFKAVPKIEIQGVMVSRLPQSMKPAPLPPRTAPWPIEGAGKPGWVDLELVDMPAGEGAATARDTAPSVRPNYAELASGVPTETFRGVDRQARGWATRLGEDIVKALKGGGDLKPRFVIALRRDEVLPQLLAKARQQFPDATRVIPSSLQFNVFLFAKGALKGRADITLLIAGDQLSVIAGEWRPVGAEKNITLAPFAVDPFAAGGPSAWRIWFEGLFHQVKARGMDGWPIAPAKNVMPYFPAVARQGVASLVAARDMPLSNLADEISRTPYDRLVLTIPRGTATVVAGRQVVGVLNIGLTAEEQELRLDEFTPRRAK